MQKLLVWCSSTCLVLLLLPLLFNVISRKSSPGLMTRSLQPVFSVRSLMVSGFKPSVHFESVFCFTRCLSACVFTSLFLYLVPLWMLAVFLFSWCAQRTPSGFLSKNSVFAGLFLCFEGFFSLWFTLYDLQLFSFCILEIWNCFLASIVALEKPISSVASLVTF